MLVRRLLSWLCASLAFSLVAAQASASSSTTTTTTTTTETNNGYSVQLQTLLVYTDGIRLAEITIKREKNIYV